jgi:hypothetical protein
MDGYSPNSVTSTSTYILARDGRKRLELDLQERLTTGRDNHRKLAQVQSCRVPSCTDWCREPSLHMTPFEPCVYNYTMLITRATQALRHAGADVYKALECAHAF